MAFDLLAIAQDGYITQGIGGGTTLIEVSAIDVVIDESPYIVQIIEQEYTVIIEQEYTVIIEDD